MWGEGLSLSPGAVSRVVVDPVLGCLILEAWKTRSGFVAGSFRSLILGPVFISVEVLDSGVKAAAEPTPSSLRLCASQLFVEKSGSCF